MPKHEFGIMEEIEPQREYCEYEPEKYNCLTIDDDIIENHIEVFKKIKTYHHSLQKPNVGLAYWGITLIPTSSLKLLIKLLREEKTLKNETVIESLILLMEKAFEANKYVIHFGI